MQEPLNNNLPKLMKPKELQDYLHIGNTKLYQLIKRKDFPSIQLGGNYYIIEEKFIEWLDHQTKKLKYKI